MIVLRTPKGWTGPKEVEDKIYELYADYIEDLCIS